MKEKIGEWFMVEGIMDYKGVKQVLEFQRHGDRHKFGQIALHHELIRGKDLERWLESIR